MNFSKHILKMPMYTRPVGKRDEFYNVFVIVVFSFFAKVHERLANQQCSSRLYIVLYMTIFFFLILGLKHN